MVNPLANDHILVHGLNGLSIQFLLFDRHFAVRSFVNCFIAVLVFIILGSCVWWRPCLRDLVFLELFQVLLELRNLLLLLDLEVVDAALVIHVRDGFVFLPRLLCLE